MENDEKFERRLTDCLLREGLLSREELTEVLNFQSRLAGSQAMSFEEVLIAMEYFPESELERIKSELNRQYSSVGNARDLEQIQKFFEMDLDAPPSAQQDFAPVSEPVPSYSPSFPEPEQHEVYTPSFPEPAAEPASPDPLAAFSAGAMPQLTPELMAMLGDSEPSDTPRLGELLLESNHLEEWQLVHALCMQKTAPGRPRLGTLLVQLGYSEHQAVKNALIKQIKQRK